MGKVVSSEVFTLVSLIIPILLRHDTVKGKAIPVTGPEGSSRLRSSDFTTISI
jgi:hypothetical protein